MTTLGEIVKNYGVINYFDINSGFIYAVPQARYDSGNILVPIMHSGFIIGNAIMEPIEEIASLFNDTHFENLISHKEELKIPEVADFMLCKHATRKMLTKLLNQISTISKVLIVDTNTGITTMYFRDYGYEGYTGFYRVDSDGHTKKCNQCELELTLESLSEPGGNLKKINCYII